MIVAATGRDMAIYHYTAVTETGENVRGELFATDPADLRTRLSCTGLQLLRWSEMTPAELDPCKPTLLAILWQLVVSSAAWVATRVAEAFKTDTQETFSGFSTKLAQSAAETLPDSETRARWWRRCYGWITSPPQAYVVLALFALAVVVPVQLTPPEFRGMVDKGPPKAVVSLVRRVHRGMRRMDVAAILQPVSEEARLDRAGRLVTHYLAAPGTGVDVQYKLSEDSALDDEVQGIVSVYPIQR